MTFYFSEPLDDGTAHLICEAPLPMTTGRVCFLSLWKDDMEREIDRRMQHFMLKTWRPRRFVWVVGDSSDSTEIRLRHFARYMRDTEGEDITVVRHDTGERHAMKSVENVARLRVLSRTADAGLNEIAMSVGDDYVIVHESDLISPANIVEHFVKNGYCPIAGSPFIDLPNGRVFYDTWAYRVGGARFPQTWPPCPGWPDGVNRVDSAGSVLMIHADDVRRGARFGVGGMVELCKVLREQFGRRIYFDKRVEIEQPVALWSC